MSFIKKDNTKFKIFQFVQAFSKLSLSFFFLNWTFTDGVHSLPIDKITGSRSSRKITIDSFPILLKIRLNMFKSVKSRHFTRLFLICAGRWICLASTCSSCSSRLSSSWCWWIQLRRHLSLKSTTWWLQTAPSFAVAI